MDVISRQAAIDIVEFECGEWSGLAKTIAEEIKQLPPAKPDIIRCRNCKIPGWCPLIDIPTPHGRLIDIKSVEYGKFTTVGNDYQRWWNGALESVIDNAPTVIEGSET